MNQELKDAIRARNVLKSSTHADNDSYRPCIAFKLNYCDGGKSDKIVGFCGVCSDKIIKLNQTMNRSWCTNPDCACARYYDGSITRRELEHEYEDYYGGAYICYESAALRDGFFAAGVDRHGTEKKINGAGKGHLCIFTTQIPDANDNLIEKERIIVSMGIIKDIGDGNGNGDAVYMDLDYSINFSLSEARNFKFWDIHSNKDKSNKNWSSSLFRYFDDAEAIQFIKKAIEIKHDEAYEVEQLLKHYCDINLLPYPDNI